jgi:hypothetical protein
VGEKIVEIKYVSFANSIFELVVRKLMSRFDLFGFKNVSVYTAVFRSFKRGGIKLY